MQDELPDPRPLRPISRRRLVATIGGAAVLLAVVVVASGGDRPSGGSVRGVQDASTILVEAVLLVLAIVAAAMTVMVLFSVQPAKARYPKPRTGPGLAFQLLGWLLLVLVVAGAIVYFRGGDGARNRQGGQNAANALRDLQRNQRNRHEVDWLPIIIVFGAAVVAFSAAGVVVMRRGPLPEPEALLAGRLSALFDETLNDLRAERDPRKAVIAAYARMERLLGRHGLPRRPAEAPHEYVTRVLEDLTASGSSVRRLTALYERAKFSPHDVDPDMKDKAIAAVEAVRDELRAREAEPLLVAPS